MYQGQRKKSRIWTVTAAAIVASLGIATGVSGGERWEKIADPAERLYDEEFTLSGNGMLEVSLGDFVLLGGEVAAMATIEAVARLVPGVLGNDASATDESHVEGLLEYPQYTRPAEFRDALVPEVLRSGNHAAIARFRRKEALRRTRDRRPDLLAAVSLGSDDQALLDELSAET
jgi:tRNA G37 N-methylase TrmD